MKHTSLKPMPVGYPVYHAISQLNRSFEDCIQNLAHLMSFHLFPHDRLRTHQIMVEEVRALANQDFTEVLDSRELENSAYYERLRLKGQGLLEGTEKASEAGKTKGKQRKAVRR